MDRSVNVRGNRLSKQDSNFKWENSSTSILKVLVDGMDQAKFRCPRNLKANESDSNLKLSDQAQRRREDAGRATLRVWLQKHPVTNRGCQYDSLESLWNSNVSSEPSQPAEAPPADEVMSPEVRSRDDEKIRTCSDEFKKMPVKKMKSQAQMPGHEDSGPQMPGHEDSGPMSSTAAAAGSTPGPPEPQDSAAMTPGPTSSAAASSAPRVVPARFAPVENPAPKSGRRRGKRAGQNVSFYNMLHKVRRVFQ